MKKSYIWGIVIILIAIVVILSVTTNKNDSTIKIGAIYPLTGGLASYGEPSQKAAQLAMDEINSAGGINGQRLEIDFQDHKCDPKTAVSVLQQLTGKGINIFTSAACTGTVFAMEPILQSSNSIMISTLTTGAKLSSSSPNFFRNWGSDIAESRLFAEKIKQSGFKKVAAIYEETDYAKGLFVTLQDLLKDSGIQISGESFQTGSTDIRTQLTKIKSQNPDMVFISPQTVTSGEIVLSQMEELKFTPTHIYVNDNITKTTELLSKHAKLLEMALGADYVIVQDSDIQSMLQRYKNKYGQDCPQVNVCAVAYDTVHLIANAIKDNGYNANAIQSYLHTVNYQGISGMVSFDGQNDRNNANYSLFQIQNGKAVLYQQ